MLTKRTEREEDGDGESSVTTVDATVETAKNSSKKPRKSYVELPLLQDVTRLLQDRGGDISAQLVLENPDILDLGLFKGTPFDYRTKCNLEKEEIERLKSTITYPGENKEKKYTSDDSASIVIHGEISSTYYESHAEEVALWLVTHWVEVKETLGKYYFAEFQKYCLEHVVKDKIVQPGCAWYYEYTLKFLARQIQTLRSVTLLYILKML